MLDHVVLTMMSDFAAHLPLQTSLVPVNLTQSHFSHNGLCFAWIESACPTGATIESDCGRLMDDLQNPARAKILMVCEEKTY